MTSAVIVAIRDAREAEFAAALASHPDLVVARRCADLAEAVAAASAGVGGVLVLSDQPRLDRAVVRTVLRKGIAVVGVPTSNAAMATLTGLGVATVVAFPVRTEEVVSAVVAAGAPSFTDGPLPEGDVAEPGARSRGALIAVWGPTGAPGRTTVATNLGVELARLSGRVVLVDADTYGGAVAQAVGLLDESPGIAGVARVALKGGSIEAAIARHSREIGWGLTVLTGFTRSTRWPELSSAAIEPIWSMLRETERVTVVDCGFGIERAGVGESACRDEATLATLAAATTIVVVGSSEPLGVQRLVQAIGDLREIEEAADTPRLIAVNRVRASVAGSRPSEAIADILARYASVPEAWMIPDDPRTCDAATLAGEPACARATRSPFRRSIEALAHRIWEDVSPAGLENRSETHETNMPRPRKTASAPRGTLRW